MTDRSTRHPVPKDSTPTRLAILSAAVQALKHAGLDRFTIEAVARRAGVAKGLVLYHFESRRRLLRLCAAEVGSERERRLAAALGAGRGADAIDAVWEELLREEEDGTARAWLALGAAGVMEPPAERYGFENLAQRAVLDGCAAALAARVPADELHDAYHALWLALLDVAPG